jgi:hypothetical protein
MKLFLKNIFFFKYFLVFDAHEKITKGENSTVTGIQRPIAVVGFRQTCLAGTGHLLHILSDPAESVQIRPDPDHFSHIRPASNYGRIPASFGRNLVRWHPATVVGCHWIPTPSVFRSPDVAEFRQPTIAEFGQSDIKHAYKD